ELHLLETDEPVQSVLEQGQRHDLLVTTPTAVTLLAGAGVPVLVARPARDGDAFPESVLAAVDGTRRQGAAVRLAAEIGAAHGSTLALVAAPGHDEDTRTALREDVAV